MIIIGVDPGARTGHAFVSKTGASSGVYRYCVMSALRDVADILATVDGFRALGDDVVMVGETWDAVAMARSYGPQVIAPLERTFAPWELLAYKAGIKVERVTPREWRRVIFGKGSGHDTRTWKKMAVNYVKARTGAIVSHDEAEAVCIGFAWHAMRGKR